MGWSLKYYEFTHINKIINNNLNLTEEISFFMGPMSKENPYPSKNLILIVKDENSLEKIYINPRKSTKIKSKLLTEIDINKLEDFINKQGMNLLNYQLNKTSFQTIIKELEIFFNKEINLNEIWNTFLNTIKSEVTVLAYETWYKETNLYEYKNKVCKIIVPTELYKKYLSNKSNYDLIKNTLSNILEENIDISFYTEKEV